MEVVSRTPSRHGSLRRQSMAPATPSLLQPCFVDNEINDAAAHRDGGGQVFTVHFVEDDLRLRTESVLGQGAFGTVYLAATPTGETLALKVSKGEIDEGTKRRFLEEVRLMKHLVHPNIVRLHCAGSDRHHMFIAMEHCLEMNLYDLVRKRPLDITEQLWIGYQLCAALQYIHSKRVLHRDLKPQNVLFDFNGNVKISDFGLSARCTEASPRKTVAGSYTFMAPELARHFLDVKNYQKSGGVLPSLQYGKEVDVWSLGIILYVIATRQTPYYQQLTKTQDKEKKNLEVFAAAANAEWNWPKNCNVDPHYRDLVSRILAKHRADRPTIDEILEDPLWTNRPQMPPSALMHSLHLINRQASTRRSTIQMADLAAQQRLQENFNSAVMRLTKSESRIRSDIAAEATHIISWIATLSYVARSEGHRREAITEVMHAERQQVYHLFNTGCMEIEAMEQQAREAAQHGRRRGSSRRQSTRDVVVPVAAASPTNVAQTASGRPSRAQSRTRASSVVSIVTPGSPNADAGILVQTSPNRYGMFYENRASSTGVKLRNVVPLAADAVAQLPQGPTYVCLNGHAMTRLTRMPKGYVAIDCNLCAAECTTLTAKDCVYRCARCDYDVCIKCAEEKRDAAIKYICVTCDKKFPSAAKHKTHMARCRGPSVAPNQSVIMMSNSPQDQSTRLTAQMSDEVRFCTACRAQFESEVQLLRHKCAGPLSRAGSQKRGRASSTRVRHVCANCDSEFANAAGLKNHERACLRAGRQSPAPHTPRLTAQQKTSSGELGAAVATEQGGAGSRGSSRVSGRSSVGFSVPAGPAAKASLARIDVPSESDYRLRSITSSAYDNEDDLDEEGEEDESDEMIHTSRASSGRRSTRFSIGSLAPPKKQSVHHIPSATGDDDFTSFRLSELESVPTPRSSSRKSSQTIEASPMSEASPATGRQTALTSGKRNNSNRVQVELNMEPSKHPSEVQKQAVPERKRSLRRPAGVAALEPMSVPELPGPIHTMNNNQTPFVSLTSRGPTPNAFAAPQPAPPFVPSAPTSRAATPLQVPRLQPAGHAPTHVEQQPVQRPNHQQQQQQRSYLALPREEAARKGVVSNFLKGSWVRYYSFVRDDDPSGVFLHYVLQPGRFGALYFRSRRDGQAVMGSVVVDINTKRVLHVDEIANDSNLRSDRHSTIDTYYGDSYTMMPLEVAQRTIPDKINNIVHFVNEFNRMQGLGETPGIRAVYINPDTHDDVRDAPITYLRRVFPDEGRSGVFFRMSNLRSQIVSSVEMFEVRWQTDARFGVGGGQKYCVDTKGDVEPITERHANFIGTFRRMLEKPEFE